MAGFFHWLIRWSAGDVVSAIALFIAIWQIVRTRSVTEQLKTAVNEIRLQLERRTAATRLNELIRDLEELKEISRNEISALSLKRFTAVRLKLIDIRLRRGQVAPKGLYKKLNEQIDSVATLLSIVQNERGRNS